MMSLIISALQVRLYRLQLRVGNRWDGGASRHSHDACCLWLLIDCNNRGTEGLLDFHLLQLSPCRYVTENHEHTVPSNHLGSHQLP